MYLDLSNAGLMLIEVLYYTLHLYAVKKLAAWY
jgi:hypothetical protein